MDLTNPTTEVKDWIGKEIYIRDPKHGDILVIVVDGNAKDEWVLCVNKDIPYKEKLTVKEFLNRVL